VDFVNGWGCSKSLKVLRVEVYVLACFGHVSYKNLPKNKSPAKRDKIIQEVERFEHKNHRSAAVRVGARRIR